MILASRNPSDKTDPIATLPPELLDRARHAALAGTSLDDFERSLLKHLLAMGHATTELFVKLQGEGNLGPTVTTEGGTTLHRSEYPQTRSFHTIYGSHAFDAFVYARGPKQTIELRPIDARIHLPAGPASYLLQEFTQLFWVEKAFGVGANQFEAIFGQKLSVASLENINRVMGQQAERFLDDPMPTPPAADEGELLILTAVYNPGQDGRSCIDRPVERVVGGSSREQFYVSASRGRHQVVVYTDDKDSLRDAIQQTDPRLSASALVTRTRLDRARRLKPRERERVLRRERVAERQKQLLHRDAREMIRE